MMDICVLILIAFIGGIGLASMSCACRTGSNIYKVMSCMEIFSLLGLTIYSFCSLSWWKTLLVLPIGVFIATGVCTMLFRKFSPYANCVLYFILYVITDWSIPILMEHGSLGISGWLVVFCYSIVITLIIAIYVEVRTSKHDIEKFFNPIDNISFNGTMGFYLNDNYSRIIHNIKKIGFDIIMDGAKVIELYNFPIVVTVKHKLFADCVDYMDIFLEGGKVVNIRIKINSDNYPNLTIIDIVQLLAGVISKRLDTQPEPDKSNEIMVTWNNKRGCVTLMYYKEEITVTISKWREAERRKQSV